MMEPARGETNPYAPPKAQVDGAAETAPASAPIWNPNAAANWSLLFTPAFGSYLHMLNWRALGQPERAASAQRWFYASIAMLAVYILMAVFVYDERASDATARLLGLVFLLTWYFSAGRPQARYVKERWGKDYPRRRWGKPLLIALGALAGFIVLAGVFGAVVGVVRGT